MNKLSPGNQGDSPKGTEMSVSLAVFLLQENISWPQLRLQAKVTRWFETGNPQGAVLSRSRHKQ